MNVLPILLYFLVFETTESSQCGYSPSVEKFKPIFHPETAQGLQNRIHSGDDTEEGQWPWVAAIQYNRNQQRCTSSILNERWVLTAAHCCEIFRSENLYDFSISTGSIDRTKGKKHAIETYVMHSSYTSEKDPNFPEYDLCLMKMKEKIVFDKDTQPICIQKDPELDDREVFVTSGWGQRFNYLKKAYQNNTLLDRKNKNVVFDIPTILQQGMMTQSYWEARPKNSYFIQLLNMNNGIGGGDSGGPLMTLRGDKWTQVGVTSAGSDYAISDTKIDFAFYMKYTKTFVYCDWIEEKTDVKSNVNRNEKNGKIFLIF